MARCGAKRLVQSRSRHHRFQFSQAAAQRLDLGVTFAHRLFERANTRLNDVIGRGRATAFGPGRLGAGMLCGLGGRRRNLRSEFLQVDLGARLGDNTRLAGPRSGVRVERLKEWQLYALEKA